ncbi:RHS repeat-associated core domain-containing protein [Parazoarcus communis]|uniref:RHS repeat-associated core domain-containing protein n=1 Tax=Parazoarcus communis TaxID=41977 RepID=UPI001402CEC3|nr:hypothetical protein [Parazoarcus communis SWub3 = DSM 12120]
MSHKSSPGRSSHFVYDGLGRRSVIEERAGLVTVGETRYAWCGQTLCQARNGSDVELRHYFEEGENWRLQGSRLVYVRDHLGSVRGLVRAGDGALIGAYDYDPYGRLISVSGLYPGEFGYAGMHHHVSSGLWLTRYRAYDSQTARWLSRDPIEEEGGVNLYANVRGNPISYTDPLRLSPNGSSGGAGSGGSQGQQCDGDDCKQTFLDCMAQCIRAYDPLNDGSKIGLTAAGGTFPKSWAGLPRGLGGASPMTTVPSVAAHALGGGGAGTLGGAARGLGRMASPVWIGYGVYFFGMEAYCATSCANNNCAH